MPRHATLRLVQASRHALPGTPCRHRQMRWPAQLRADPRRTPRGLPAVGSHSRTRPEAGALTTDAPPATPANSTSRPTRRPGGAGPNSTRPPAAGRWSGGSPPGGPTSGSPWPWMSPASATPSTSWPARSSTGVAPSPSPRRFCRPGSRTRGDDTTAIDAEAERVILERFGRSASRSSPRRSASWTATRRSSSSIPSTAR